MSISVELDVPPEYTSAVTTNVGHLDRNNLPSVVNVANGNLSI